MSDFVLAKGARALSGSSDMVRRSLEQMQALPVDQVLRADPGFRPETYQSTLRDSVSVTGPGTFFGKAQRTLVMVPSQESGWWLDRRDIPDSLPIAVSVKNVWTTARNIVLCAGSPHNYVRMVEHIVALRIGLGLDNLMIRMDSGDPPLFDRGSMDLVEAVERAGVVTGRVPVPYVTVREPVSIEGPHGSFVCVLPAERGSRLLSVDCAIDFKTAIGRQRIQFDVTPAIFRHGALARTNCSLWQMLFTKTIGKLLADVRHLGYTNRNILIAGPKRYFNEPKLVHQGKSLEAAWHRATLDLLAAVALADTGRLCGRILSYKAGHALDVQLIRLLYQENLLVPVG